MQPLTENLSEKQTFWKIVRASATNIAGFGAATFAVIFLQRLLEITILFKILSVVIALIVLISVSGLLVFIYYTIKGMPQTMREKPEGTGFFKIYGLIVTALLIRCVEGAICVYCLVLLYREFM